MRCEHALQSYFYHNGTVCPLHLYKRDGCKLFQNNGHHQLTQDIVNDTSFCLCRDFFLPHECD